MKTLSNFVLLAAPAAFFFSPLSFETSLAWFASLGLGAIMLSDYARRGGARGRSLRATAEAAGPRGSAFRLAA
jgi:hypothetical protein